MNPNNRRELWMQFLNASSEEEFEVLKQTNVPIMNKAVNIIYDLSEDTKIREMARLREKALHDEASALANAKNEGKAEGRAEGISIGEAKGRAEGKAEAEADIIKKMKAYGMSEEQIKAILSKG